MSQSSVSSAGKRLIEAEEELVRHLETVEVHYNRRDAAVVEADVCLGVKTVFNAFVDLNAWLQAWGGEDISEAAVRVVGLFQRAKDVLVRGVSAKAPEYLKSVEQKISYVGELKSGKTLHELLSVKTRGAD